MSIYVSLFIDVPYSGVILLNIGASYETISKPDIWALHIFILQCRLEKIFIIKSSRKPAGSPNIEARRYETIRWNIIHCSLSHHWQRCVINITSKGRHLPVWPRPFHLDLYTLPEHLNSQLCVWWRDHDYCYVFDLYWRLLNKNSKCLSFVPTVILLLLSITTKL